MLVLASASPRRRELLGRIVGDFVVRPADADETVAAGTSWDAAVRQLALRKAFAAAQPGEGNWILAADTIVVLGDRILGKPRDRDEARQMLAALSGQTHRVATGYALLNPALGRIYPGMDVTEVHFRQLTGEDIEWYVSTDEPYDKAGAYGIQGLAAPFVDSIHGDYSNVVGLPLAALYGRLKALGFAPQIHGK